MYRNFEDLPDPDIDDGQYTATCRSCGSKHEYERRFNSYNGLPSWCLHCGSAL